MSIVPGLLERYEQRIQALNEGMRALERIGAKALEERKTKECSRCKDPKPLTEFYRRASSKDGLQAWCRRCNTETQRKYRSKRGQKRQRRQKEAVAAQMRDGWAQGFVHAMDKAAERQQELPTVREWQSQVDQGQQHDVVLTKAPWVVVGLAIWMIIVLLVLAVVS